MISLDTLSLWELATNVGSGAICLALTIILLCFRSEWEKKSSPFVPLSDKNATGYTYMKRLLALAAFFSLVVDAVISLMICHGVDFTLLSVFFIPVICYFQLLCATFALLYLIHSRKARFRRNLYLSGPVFVYFLIYTLVYLSTCGFQNSYEAYKEFSQGVVSRTMSGILLGVIFVEVVASATLLYKEVKRYRQAIDNFFSGTAEVNAMVMAKMVYCFLAYFAFVVINSLVMIFLPEDISRILNIIVVMVNTAVFVICVIFVLNLHNYYFSVAQGFAALDSPDANVLFADFLQREPFLPAKHKKHHTQAQQASSPTEHTETVKKQTAASESPQSGGEVLTSPKSDPLSPASTSSADDSVIDDGIFSKTIELKVEDWSKSNRKRFLQEGLTINDVADEMSVSPRLLSDYLNNIYKLNFNSWINSLRITEVKSILLDEPKESLASIAYRTGFTDASAMSKIFKKFEGITPSTFRFKHNAKGER